MRRLLFQIGTILTLALAGCRGQTTAEKTAAPQNTSDAKQPDAAAPPPTPRTAQPAVSSPPSTTAPTAPPSKNPSHALADTPPAVAANDAAQAPPVADPIDDTIRKPATVAEAARALDLTTFPLLPNAKTPGARLVASLSYVAPADVKSALEFQRRNLIEQKWRELPGAHISEGSANATFTRDGFHVSVAVMTVGKSGEVHVMLHNHGNVNLRKLPVPPGVTLRYGFPITADFITDAPAAETAAALKKLLVEQGWQPYGIVADTTSFKQNAVLLDARVFAPPTLPKKTVIDFTSRQLSADLPAPPSAESIDYTDEFKLLEADSPLKSDEVLAFYQKTFASAGWKPTTDKPITDAHRQMLIFRNPEKDMLTLTLHDGAKTHVKLEHRSAAEVAEIDRKIKAQVAKAKKERDEQEKERNKPKPKVALTLPADAQKIETTPTEIEFQLPSGQAKTALAALDKQLTAAGWKADRSIGGKSGGKVSFKKDEHEISIHYIDPGVAVVPARISISARTKVELQPTQPSKSP